MAAADHVDRQAGLGLTVDLVGEVADVLHAVLAAQLAGSGVQRVAPFLRATPRSQSANVG